jgi:hypothetical protein
LSELASGDALVSACTHQVDRGFVLELVDEVDDVGMIKLQHHVDLLQELLLLHELGALGNDLDGVLLVIRLGDRAAVSAPRTRLWLRERLTLLRHSLT